MYNEAQRLSDTLVDLRRRIHRRPELGFQEYHTARLIADYLAGLGVNARTGIAKTGVVADLGDGSPCIALRADMDALPIQEENVVPYASEVPGIMHACGHDVHVACLLGAAQLLAAEAAAGRLPGRVRFLFQPSEEGQDDEGLSGAMRMVDEGVMDGVGAVAGLHVWTDLPVGTVGLRAGTSTAYPDKFELLIKGQEAHAAFPHRGVDAISLAAQVIIALQTVVSRRLDPTRGKVLTIGTIQGGTKENVLAGQVRMTGTIRTFEPEIREALFARMEQACSVARVLGGDYELTIIPGYIPVINDLGLTDLVRDVAAEMVGQENVIDSALEMGGEDFSYFAREAPGCFFLIGAATPGQPQRLHHHPRFDVDERCLPLGAALLAGVARRWLQEVAV